jgi:hypothetical protein
MDDKYGFEEIFKILKENIPKSAKLAKILNHVMTKYEIPKEAYIILGSYALRNYREISDLDVDMDESYFSLLEVCKLGSVSLRGEEYVWAFNHTYENINYIIEVYATNPDKNFPNDNFSINSLHSSKALQNDEYDQYYYKLDTLLIWKETVNRDKDQKDIDLIKNILLLNKKKNVFI